MYCKTKASAELKFNSRIKVYTFFFIFVPGESSLHDGLCVVTEKMSFLLTFDHDSTYINVGKSHRILMGILKQTWVCYRYGLVKQLLQYEGNV